MEQILIRNLPEGTKAALRARASVHQQSVEAEAREILTDALRREPATMVDLLGSDDGGDIDFEPERLGLAARSGRPVSYLLDTNVVSALRVRGRHPRVEPSDIRQQ